MPETFLLHAGLFYFVETFSLDHQASLLRAFLIRALRACLGEPPAPLNSKMTPAWHYAGMRQMRSVPFVLFCFVRALLTNLFGLQVKSFASNPVLCTSGIGSGCQAMRPKVSEAGDQCAGWHWDRCDKRNL